MTCVLNLKYYQFSDKKNGDRGIENGSMIAIEKHSRRADINIQRCEIKMKQRTNINKNLSHKNVSYKKLDYAKIEEMKERKHAKNAVGAFGLIFDFQDTAGDDSSFDTDVHKIMIDKFLKDYGITERFELLSMHCHRDEKNLHYHVMFSGWDMIEQKYAVNKFFSPKGKKTLVYEEDGVTPVYMRNPKGKFRLDENGDKIQLTKDGSRANGTQLLQDFYEKWLQDNNLIYTGKKEFQSLLSINRKIWQFMSQNDKEKVYAFRKLEKLFNKTKKVKNSEKSLKKIHDTMIEMLSSIIETSQQIKERIFTKKNNKDMK